MLAICPECQRAITVETHGWNSCKFCSKQIWIPDPMSPDSPPSPLPSSDEQPAREPEPGGTPGWAVPWETFQIYGIFRAFTLTLRGALFQSREFFSRLDNEPPSKLVFIYGELLVTIGLIFYFLLQAYSIRFLQELQKTEGPDLQAFPLLHEMLKSMEQLKLDVSFFIISAILAPLFAFVILWLTTKLFTTGYVWANRESVPPRFKIFRVAVYSYTPWLFLGLPVVGLFWCLVLQYRALRCSLRLSMRMAIILVVINILFLNGFYNLWITLHALFNK